MSKILCKYNVIFGYVQVVCIFLGVEIALFDVSVECLGVGFGFVW